MWRRFTEKARKAIFTAQQEAQSLGVGYLSPEHLLLGLLKEESSLAMETLNHLGISAPQIRQEIERAELSKQFSLGDVQSCQDVTLSPKAKKVISLAHSEANYLGNNYIGTEHLLLGLVLSDSPATRVLDKLGVKLDPCREAIRKLKETKSRVSTDEALVPFNREGLQKFLSWATRAASYPDASYFLKRIDDTSYLRLRAGDWVYQDQFKVANGGGLVTGGIFVLHCLNLVFSLTYNHEFFPAEGLARDAVVDLLRCCELLSTPERPLLGPSRLYDRKSGLVYHSCATGTPGDENYTATANVTRAGKIVWKATYVATPQALPE